MPARLRQPLGDEPGTGQISFNRLFQNPASKQRLAPRNFLGVCAFSRAYASRAT